MEKREKTVEEKIIDILKERQPLYPKSIAGFIYEDRDYVKDCLYNKLGNKVYRDELYYWWIKDCSFRRTHDKIYYYTDFIKSVFWRYRDESEIEDSLKVHGTKVKVLM